MDRKNGSRDDRPLGANGYCFFDREPRAAPCNPISPDGQEVLLVETDEREHIGMLAGAASTIREVVR
jgi:hypothetical protein